MGKLLGKASLTFHLERLHISLTDEQKDQLLRRIVELGDQKRHVTTADLPFLISRLLQTPELRVFEVKDYSVVSNRGLQPVASILVRFRGKELQATASGDGGYDALMTALRSVESELGLRVPRLVDYEVRIPPGGKTDALVETTIQWEGGLTTRGVDTDQLADRVASLTPEESDAFELQPLLLPVDVVERDLGKVRADIARAARRAAAQPQAHAAAGDTRRTRVRRQPTPSRRARGADRVPRRVSRPQVGCLTRRGQDFSTVADARGGRVTPLYTAAR